MIEITVNGQTATGEAGQTILDLAAGIGIEIPTLCHHESVQRYGACGLCVVEAAGNPKLLRACSTVATDGMVVETDTPRVRQSRKIALELLLSDHEGDCLGPCVLNCPAGTDCQGYVKQIALGNDYEAVRIIKEKIPLPASIGRICPHPCEDNCRRRLVEQPLSIAFLKSFAADNDLASAHPYQPTPAPLSGKRAAVIGGGPGGLTAAYYLALAGHQVTVLEAMPKMGGMLRYGIPEYRLPKLVLDAEIAGIAALGVRMVNNVRVGQELSLTKLREDFDAVVVAIGAWKSSGLGCSGEDLPQVLGGIDFLREAALGGKPALGDKVAVVGGGNTAMDACRSAVRLGAKEVTVVYRRTEAEMPAEPAEIAEAKEEGVIFRFLAAPAAVLEQDGKVTGMKLQLMELGEPDAGGRRSPKPIAGAFETMAVDTVIAAIGQKADLQGLEELELNRRGNIAADEHSFRTNLEKVFAVGDATNQGADIAIAAIAEAGKAAAVVDSFLKGRLAPCRKPYVSVAEPDQARLQAEHEPAARAQMLQRPPELRKRDFGEINFGFSQEQAREEARRCLECGCHDYGDCRLIRYANRYPLDTERFRGEKHDCFQEEKLVSIHRDQGKCILCNLCVRVCEEVEGKGILGLVGRGFATVVKPEFEHPETIAACLDCHKCVDACVTGALKLQTAGERPGILPPEEDGLGLDALGRAEVELREWTETVQNSGNNVLLARARLTVLESGGEAPERRQSQQEMRLALYAQREALEKALRVAYELQRKYGRAMISCHNELASVQEQLDAFEPYSPDYAAMAGRATALRGRAEGSERFYRLTGEIIENWKRQLFDVERAVE